MEEKMKIQLCKCGHEPNGLEIRNGIEIPVCAICAGTNPDYDKVEEVEIDLSKRKCRCSYCGRVVPSDKHVAFFELRLDREFDRHYCGCRGWD